MSASDWYSFYVGRPHGYRAMGSEQSEEERKKKEDKMGNFKGHTKTRITDQRITEHGSRFRYRIACHNYYSMVIIFHSTWEPVSRNHLKMAGVCKGAISATEAYFMDDTRLVGNRMIE